MISRKGSEIEPLPLCRTPISGRSRNSFSFGMASPRRSSFVHSDQHARPKERRQNSNIVIKSIYGLAFLSWVMIRAFSADYPARTVVIEKNAKVIKAQMVHMIEELKLLDGYIKEERKHLTTLQKTKKAIDHEIRFYTEVEKTTGERIIPTPRNGNENLIKNWLTHRTDSLLGKISMLQRRLQLDSKKAVLDR